MSLQGMTNRPAHDTILKIGSQELLPIGDYYRFVIRETLPHKGYKFKFGIRDKLLKIVACKGKRLAVSFSEHPGLEFVHNPIRWLALGRPHYETKLFKDRPMLMHYFYVNFRDEVEKPAQEKLFV